MSLALAKIAEPTKFQSNRLNMTLNQICAWGNFMRRCIHTSSDVINGITGMDVKQHHLPRPIGIIYLDSLQHMWSPVYGVTRILTSIQSLLSDHNVRSFLNNTLRMGITARIIRRAKQGSRNRWKSKKSRQWWQWRRRQRRRRWDRKRLGAASNRLKT